MEPFNSPIQGFDGWNVNSSYLTPAYMANFRPKYGDGSYRPNSFTDNTTAMQSLYRMGPGDHAYGRDVLQDAEYDRYNLVTGAGDAAVAGLQHVAIPAAAWYAASKINKMGTLFGGNSLATRTGAAMGRTTARAATGMLGRGASMIGMGQFASPAAAGALASGAGALGGVVGGLALPVAAAQAMASVADTMLIDPYVSTRRGMDAMMANTARTSVFGSGASTSGGFGMSATRAQEIAQALTVAGGQDLMLETGSYNEIADNMMRAGIFQEVGDMDANKVVDGVKKATSVLKLIQRITGDPDIKNGIQTLATLKAGGLDDIQQMGVAVNRLRAASASSGISMDQLMNTIGNQGAVMAQQNGISANTGMLASADAFAGFTAARRSGLISGTESAMLGGVEGMTQNLMGGAYQTLNSGISRMIMQGNGAFGGMMTDNISKWGSGFSSDPLRSQGDWIMNQSYYKDKAMNEVGAGNIILQALQGKARSLGLDPNDDEVLASLTPMLGITPEQFRSASIADRSARDPRARMNQTDSLAKSDISNRVTEMQNNFQGLYAVPVIGDAQRGMNEIGRAFNFTGATIMDNVTSATAYLSDKWTETISGAKGLENLSSRTHLVQGGDGSTKQVRFKGMESSTSFRDGRLVDSDKYSELFSKLNALAKDPKLGDSAKELQKAIMDGDIVKVRELAAKLDVKGTLSGDATGGFTHSAFLDTFEQDVKRGAISMEEVRSLRLNNDSGPGLRGELAMSELLTKDKRAAKITKMIGEGKGSQIAAMYGISTEGFESLTEDQRKQKILEGALEGTTHYGEIDLGSDEKNIEEFYDRFQEMGFTKEQIKNYAESKGGIKSIIDTDLQDTFMQGIFSSGDKTTATKDIARDMQSHSDAEARRKQLTTTDIQWDSIKDVTGGVKALGEATQANTRATIENTIAIASMNSGSKGYSQVQEKYESMYGKPSSKETTVTNTDPQTVPGYP